MIYIKRLNTCFIGQSKTGSTSTNIFFIMNFLQQEDVLSPFTLPSADLRRLNFHPVQKAIQFDYLTKGSKEQISLNFYIDIIKKQVNSAEFVLENGLVPLDANFITIIRDPFEKLLSSYFHKYHKKERTYHLNCTPKEFRNILKDSLDKSIPQNERSLARSRQTRVLEYDTEINREYWCFDYLQKHVDEFATRHNIEVRYPLIHKGRTITDGYTKDYIEKYYDDETKKLVSEYYVKDFKLYNEVKNKWSRIFNEQ